MKKLLLLSIILCAFSTQAQQAARAFAGKEGIFILCGDSLPKKWSYSIERRSGSGTWKEIAAMAFPYGKEELRARLLQGNKGGLPFKMPTDYVIDSLWKKLRLDPTSFALGNLQVSTPWLFSIGCGFWDEDAVIMTDNSYRILKKDKAGKVLSESMSAVVRYPGPAAAMQMKLGKKTVLANEVQLEIILAEYAQYAGCRVYRNHYLMNDAMEIYPAMGYRNEDGKMHLIIHDKDVAPKAQYTYRIIPYDNFGNEGKALENIDVYNAGTFSLDAAVSRPTAESDENRDAIRISWKTLNRKDIISLDIYRGEDYDGFFRRIISLGPKDTVYYDRGVTPMTTYHYSIVVNTTYARSYPSVRFNGVLKAKRANLLPPADFRARRVGDVVKMSWKRSSADTKGYYVYRSFSYTEAPQLISPLIRSNDSLISFTDSLKDVTRSEAVMVYAVADENTSYNISPLSNKVAIPGIVRHLPVAWPIDTRMENGQILLLWEDVYLDYPGLDGYYVYRKSISMDDKVVEDWKRLNSKPTGDGVNSYADPSVKEGLRYQYALEAVGLDKSTGTRSPAVSVYIQEVLPQAPANLRAIATAGNIKLEWDAVMDPGIVKYLVYRSDTENAPRLIAELKSQETGYQDKSVQGDKTYFYSILTESLQGKKCKDEATIGIRTK